MRTIGLAPPDAGDATARLAPAIRTVAATLTADTATTQPAARAAHGLSSFLLHSLGPVAGTAFGPVLRVVIRWILSSQWRTLVRSLVHAGAGPGAQTLMIVTGVVTCGSSPEGAGSSPGYLRT